MRESKWLLPAVIIPPETVCFKIHIPKDAGYIQAFFGNLEKLARAWNWEDSFNDGSQVAYVWRDLIDEAVECFRQDSCCMPILRPNPTDACLIEQSYDCGDTWETLVDLNECVTAAVQPISDAQGDRILQELLDKYDGTAASISSRLVYDAGPDDAHRDVALCNALELFVDAMADLEIDRRAQSEQYWEEVPETLVSIAAVLWIMPVPGARFLAIGAALVAAFIQVGNPVWNLLTLAMLQNEDARELVSCSMYNAMKGATPTFSAFQSSLDFPLYVPFSDADFIGNAVKVMIQELEIYITFLQLWADIYPFAKGGFIDTCGCPDPGWTVKFLNGAGRPPNWAIVSNPPYDDATYNSPGDYWFATDTPSEPVSSVFCNIEFEIAGTFTFEWAFMSIDLQTTSGDANPTGQKFDLYDDLGALIVTHSEPGYTAGNTPAVVAWEAQHTDVQKVRLHAKLFEPNNGETTRAEIRDIRIHGSGTIPPEWAAYEV